MFSKDRIKVIIGFIIVMFSLLIVRLFSLQIIQGDEYAKEVTSQRAISNTLKKIRGNIYDKNMIPFTNRHEIFYLLIIPNSINNLDYTVERLSEITDYSISHIKKNLYGKNQVIFKVEGYSEKYLNDVLCDCGVKVIKSTKRYDKNSLARHLIGYVNNVDYQGCTGIEQIFNSYLTTDKIQSVVMVGYPVKRFIPGLGFKVTNCSYKNNLNGVKLTLDYHIQKIVEQVLNKEMKKGAVVVTDVSSGDVLALANRPNYIQDNVEKYIDSRNGELLNKAFRAYDLGSIFKIIVSAEALEENIVDLDTIYNCSGYIDVDGQEFKCSQYQNNGHGEICFADAFAYSCNCTFIELGLELGYNNIINMAKKFGLGSRVPIYIGIKQQEGNMPEKMYVSDREIANISLGQGEILVTPIQVSDIITTIANNGVRKKLNIVDSIVSDTGNVVKEIRYEDDNRIISLDTARKIQNMMEKTVKYGTGKEANLDKYGGAAGKTGSAETGWLDNNRTMVHAWFAGYFPLDNPKYVIVVFVENGKWGGKSAAPIFQEIAEQICEIKGIK